MFANVHWNYGFGNRKLQNWHLVCSIDFHFKIKMYLQFVNLNYISSTTMFGHILFKEMLYIKWYDRQIFFLYKTCLNCLSKHVSWDHCSSMYLCEVWGHSYIFKSSEPVPKMCYILPLCHKKSEVVKSLQATFFFIFIFSAKLSCHDVRTGLQSV